MELPLTEEELELLEPAPDIHALFVHYNELYFESKLGACSVEWSSARMTRCGGTCELLGGGAGGCRIKLSKPLLQLRPTRDLKETLLHEMTHAYMMLQGIRDDDRGGHGTIFKGIINRINTSRVPDPQRPPGGYFVSTTHTMVAEVEHYQQHHWRCERCGNLVKRAMNRPPQEADCRGRMGRGADCRDPYCRFHMHQKHCGGTWIKIKEPEGYKPKGKKQGGSSSTADNNNSSSASNAGRGRGSAGGGSASARREGAPLPAKRPRKGGRGLPASAAAGTRSIIEFVGAGRSAGQQGSAAAAAAATATATATAAAAATGHGSSEVLPALQAVPGAATAAASKGRQQEPAKAAEQQQLGQQAQQGQQVQQQTAELPEPSAEERRRLLAEAAMRRLAGSAGKSRQLGSSSQQQEQQEHGWQQQWQQQQQPDPGGHGGQMVQAQRQLPQAQQQQHNWQQEQQGQADAQQCQDVIDLLDSPPEAAPGAQLRAGAVQQQWAGIAQQHQGAAGLPTEAASASLGIGDNRPAADAATGGNGSGPNGPCMQCPVCGRQWSSAAVSNAELNAHIDECLNASFL